MGLTLEEYNQKIKRLNESFLAQLPEKLETISNCWVKICSKESTITDLRTLYHVAHKLAGSSAIFGQPDIGVVANRIQILISDSSNPDDFLERTKKIEIDTLIKELIGKIESPQKSKSTLLENKDLLIDKAAQSQKNILIVDDDKICAESSACLLEAAGFKCTVIPTLAPLEDVIIKTSPNLIIMDMSFPENRYAGAWAIASISKKNIPLCPVIFHSSDSREIAEDEARHAGGCYFLKKPTTANELVKAVNQFVK